VSGALLDELHLFVRAPGLAKARGGTGEPKELIKAQVGLGLKGAVNPA
jgi:hypothetical protein